MTGCYCQNCGYEGPEDDFFREDVHDLVDVLQESFEEGKISETSFNNLMDVFNTDICPNCGEKESMLRYGGGGIFYYTSDGMVSADEYHAGSEESADDPEMLDQLYADGIIDEYEWWERKHG